MNPETPTLGPNEAILHIWKKQKKPSQECKNVFFLLVLPLENSLFWWFVCEALFPVCVTLLSLAAWKLHLQTLMEHWDLHWKTTGSVSFSKFTPDFLTTDQSVQKSTNCRLSQTDRLPKFIYSQNCNFQIPWVKRQIFKNYFNFICEKIFENKFKLWEICIEFLRRKSTESS